MADREGILRELGVDVLANLLTGGFIVFMASPSYELLYADKTLLSLMGEESLASLLERSLGSFLNCIVAEDRAAVLALGEKPGDDACARLSVRMICRDGSALWTSQHSRRVRLSDGEVAVIAACDETGSRRGETEITAEKQKNAFEQALSSLGLRYWEYDIRTHRLYRSALVQGEVGYDAYRDNVPESYVEDGIIHPDYAQAYLDFYHHIQQGKNERLVFRSLYQNGNWGWLDISYKVLFDESGCPYKAIGVGGDVTDRMRSEERLHAVEEQKHTIEQMLESAAVHEYDYVSFIDGRTDRCISFSALLAGKVRYVDSFERQLFRDLSDMRFDDLAGMSQTLRLSRILSELDKAGSYVVDGTGYTEDGRRMRKKFSFYFIDPEKRHILGTARDITDMYEQNERQKHALQDALDAAKAASTAKSSFLSSMSHEIRTPMNAILGMAALGLEETEEAAARDYFGKIKSSGDFLLGLINDILDMSRIEQGHIELHEEFVSGTAFLQDIADMLRPLAEQRGVRLEVDMSAATTPWVKMDRLRSQQIYVNLLNNAIKFSEPGSTVSWRIVDQVLDDHRMHMVCTVEDHGCGMSEAFQKQVFQPFAQERLHGVTPQQGTGLGLSIVKNLVEQMGGTITFTSRLGEGTTFVMALDREISFAPKPQQCAPVDRLGTLPEGLHVLLCEDHPLNAQIAYKMLSRKGVVCDVAENGQVGVDRFAASAIGGYDAVLMDVRMPVMDGLAATRAIRALPRADAAGVPIIAMTANAYDEDVRACLEAGMNAHVAKPVEPALLYVTLARCLKCR